MLRNFFRQFNFTISVVALCIASSSLLSATDDPSSPALQPANATAPDTKTGAASQANALPKELPPPLAAQYVGTNQCFQCHRPQTTTWSETKHAHAFADVPQKYQGDPACLKCHVTGFGKPGGYVAGTEKNLLMVGCEACHGPGAGHVDATQRFVLASPDEEANIEKEMRDTIVRTPTDSVCIACHIMQAHQRHPAYDGQVLPGAASGSVVPCMPTVPCGTWTTSTTAPVHDVSKYSVKTCGGCHYDQYKQWSTGKHFDLFAMLPAKYSSNQDCQQCHPKGGAVAQSATIGSESQHGQIGAVCESCHGPALEHVRFTRQFISSPPLGPKLEQMARDAISKGKPDSLCVQCHVGQRHQQHPQFAEK